MNVSPRLYLVGAVLIFCTVGAVNLIGCGSAGTGSAIPSAARGEVRLEIHWPSPTRLIPAATQSLSVSLSAAGRVVAQQTIARPSGSSTSIADFKDIAPGSLTLAAVAYPESGAAGIPLSSGSEPVTVQLGGVTSVTLTMASTIAAIAMSPPSPSVDVGGSLALAANATDASGSVVLVAPGVLRWSSSNTSVATVDGSGNVTGVAAGAATITVTDTESGKSGAATLTVGGSVGGGGTGGIGGGTGGIGGGTDGATYPANGQVPGTIQELGTPGRKLERGNWHQQQWPGGGNIRHLRGRQQRQRSSRLPLYAGRQSFESGRC